MIQRHWEWGGDNQVYGTFTSNSLFFNARRESLAPYLSSLNIPYSAIFKDWKGDILVSFVVKAINL